MKVFVSYSRSDHEVVKSIVDSLSNHGIEFLFNQEGIEAGEDFASIITQSIESSDCIMFFHSRNSRESQWCSRELLYAQHLRKQFIGINIDGSELTDRELFKLGRYRFLQFKGECDERFVNEVLSAIHTLYQSRNPEIWRPEHNNAQLSEYNSLEKSSGCGCSWIVAVIVILVLVFVFFPRFKKGTQSNSGSRDESDTIEFVNLDDDIMPCDTAAMDSVGTYEPSNNAEPLPGALPEDNNPDDAPGYSGSEVESPIATPVKDDKSEDNSAVIYSAIGTFIATSLLFWMIAYIRRRFSKYDVKIGSEFPAILNIDGEEIDEIKAHGVLKEKLDKGHYMVDFESTKNADHHLTYELAVGRDEKNCVLAKSDELKQLEAKDHVIKIFIAGSTSLERERDALRSVISIMYNKWQSHDFKILSYTFEDFSNKFKADGGQQSEYDKFIENEADWAVFIIDGQIGGITRDELLTALTAHKKSGKPNILAFSNKNSEDTEEIRDIRKLIMEEGQYWTSYSTVQELKREFESTLNWDLIEMIKAR